MATNFAVVYPQVRVLKKVRRQFLHKTPDLNQEQNENQNILQQVNNDTHTIQPSLGFFEKGKKLFVAAEFVNLHFNITKTLIEKRPQSRIVTLDVSPKEHDSRIPLEEAVKRLESYGDLECATWAHGIRNHQASYRKAMANYYEIMKSRDPQIQANYRKVQQKAVLTCREIERTYPFQKYVQFLKKDTHQLASCSYSEDFLKEMGFTPESFILWTQSNGIPKIFETNNDLYYNIIKAFYSFVPILTQPVIECGEIETNLYDKENRLRRVKVRFINILEPRADMPLNHCYLIINKEKLDVPQETIRQRRIEIKETDSPTKTEGMNTPGDIKNVTAIP